MMRVVPAIFALFVDSSKLWNFSMESELTMDIMGSGLPVESSKLRALRPSYTESNLIFS